jgi:carboxyl-terminal processing protease
MRKKQIVIWGLIILAVAALFGSGFLFGFRFGEKFPQTLIVKGVANLESGQPQTTDFSTFWQAWQLIHENYLKDKEVSDQNRVYGAIQGLVRSLNDPHSEFFSPSESKKFEEDIQGNFGGIGIEIDVRKNQLMVIAPLKNTPASRAGLRAGDKILMINSSSTEGLSVDQAVKWIRGPENTEVKLLIFRDDWEKPREFKIVRATIEVPTLDYEVKDGIVQVKLYSFNANAGKVLYDAMINTIPQGAKGMVLDLRNNPGGYLEVAVNLAGWFLERGTLVVSEVSRSDSKENFKANGNAALVKFPVVVLINQGSASASEILAGALRDQRKIKLVGEQSFGKGTVQQVLPLKDNSSLKITIAHWVLPSGQILEGNGLKPDIEVKMTEEDIINKRDPQLEKAMEILKQEIASSK